MNMLLGLAEFHSFFNSNLLLNLAENAFKQKKMIFHSFWSNFIENSNLLSSSNVFHNAFVAKLLWEIIFLDGKISFANLSLNYSKLLLSN